MDFLLEMVNTFITYRKKEGELFLPDYKKSAKSLDIPRLRKQCVEAYQILNILRHLKKIAKLEGWKPFPKVEDSSPSIIYSSFLERVEWCKTVRKKYLAFDYRYVKIEGVVKKISLDNLPIRMQNNKDYSILPKSNEIFYMGKLYPREKILLPGDELFSLGFSQHAIVKMWIGYEDSLKEYINTHVDIYSTKTKKNGEKCSIRLPRYADLPATIIHPWWIVFYDGVILSHRAALLRKEYYRKEPPHYFLNPDFTSIPTEWKKRGYVWTASLKDPEYILDLLLSKNIDPKDICAPVNEKAKKYILDEEGYVKIFLVKKYF